MFAKNTNRQCTQVRRDRLPLPGGSSVPPQRGQNRQSSPGSRTEPSHPTGALPDEDEEEDTEGEEDEESEEDLNLCSIGSAAYAHPLIRPALLVHIGGPQPPISNILSFEIDLI